MGKIFIAIVLVLSNCAPYRTPINFVSNTNRVYMTMCKKYVMLEQNNHVLRAAPAVQNKPYYKKILL